MIKAIIAAGLITLPLTAAPALAQSEADVRYHVATGVSTQDNVCDQERTGTAPQCTNFAVSDSTAHTFTALPSFLTGVGVLKTGDTMTGPLAVTGSFGGMLTMAASQTPIGVSGSPALLPFGGFATRGYVYNNETGPHSSSGAYSTQVIAHSAVGSGLNGPGYADYALIISDLKSNYLTSTQQGEIDGGYVIARQGHQGDTGGLLFDMQKAQTASTFVGSVSGTAGTVASGTAPVVGQTLYGHGVTGGTTIVSVSGSSFTVSTSQTVPSEPLYATADGGGITPTEISSGLVDSSGNLLSMMHNITGFIEGPGGVSSNTGYGFHAESWLGTQYAAFDADTINGTGGSAPYGWQYLLAATHDRSIDSQYFSIAGDKPTGPNAVPGDIVQGLPGNRKTIRTASNGTWQLRNSTDTGSLIQVTDAGLVTFGGLVALPFYTPPSSTTPCVQGVVTIDATYTYTCVATNSWHRVSNGASW